jgi:hypothetical protein
MYRAAQATQAGTCGEDDSEWRHLILDWIVHTSQCEASLWLALFSEHCAFPFQNSTKAEPSHLAAHSTSSLPEDLTYNSSLHENAVDDYVKTSSFAFWSQQVNNLVACIHALSTTAVASGTPAIEINATVDKIQLKLALPIFTLWHMYMPLVAAVRLRETEPYGNFQQSSLTTHKDDPAEGKADAERHDLSKAADGEYDDMLSVQSFQRPRILLGIAGCAAAGKSTAAALFTACYNALYPERYEH